MRKNSKSKNLLFEKIILFLNLIFVLEIIFRIGVRKWMWLIDNNRSKFTIILLKDNNNLRNQLFL